MEFTNVTPLAAGYTTATDKTGREHLIVVAKATYSFPLAPGAAPERAQQSLPLLMTDTFTGEPGFSAPLDENDFAPRKPRCDVLLKGSAHAPDGRPVERVRVGLRVGQVSKTFYKTSPLGDEAATNGQGAGVITHVITGKTYFIMWSMDVKIEGKNVPRHTDLTTSNHASPMANTFVPNLNSAKMKLQKVLIWENQTCRNEVLEGVQGRQKRLEAQLNASENCNSRAKGRALLAQGNIPCSAIQRRVGVLNKVLAARQEKQAKCFNDPSKDKTAREKDSRKEHDKQIEAVKDNIRDAKARAKINCKPGHPMAGL